MTSNSLHDRTLDQLVDQFVAIAAAQGQALLRLEIGKANQLYDQLQRVVGELKSRDGDQRGALMRLYGHSDAQVRLKAAKATLAVAPDIARAMLQKIADSREYPQAGEAGMSISNLEKGIFKPV